MEGLVNGECEDRLQKKLSKDKLIINLPKYLLNSLRTKRNKCSSNKRK